ncbi:hypothetical protein IQ07DRAFT_664348 [Pyrenochaeta sp. DS3sAY3a]|nr:hypothetical protein IQ07DRAFT_664348 [Pyrenochaeta sp. DS3sAY3a]
MADLEQIHPSTRQSPKTKYPTSSIKPADTRLPQIPIVPDAGDDYGTLNTFSWAKAQTQISEWKHFTTTIEGPNVAFIHEKTRKREADAIPLLLLHGRPGMFEYVLLVSSFIGLALALSGDLKIPEHNASAPRPVGRESPSLRPRGAVAARLLLVAGSAARMDTAG